MARPIATPTNRRPSSGVSLGGGSPRSTVMSRPMWAWESGQRPLSSASFASSTRHPTAGTPLNQSLSNSIGYPGGPSNNNSAAPNELNTRQWSFIAFEWTINNVTALRDHVEGSTNIDNLESLSERSVPDDDDHIPSVLKDAPMLDDRFMLEISRTRPQEALDDTSNWRPDMSQESLDSPPSMNTLSLLITMHGNSHSMPETPTTMMAAIRHKTSIGENGGRNPWAWQIWERFTYGRNSEVWECALPTLSSLLQHPRISASDAFVLCIQIHTPEGPVFPHHPSAYYVPRDLLEGIEASLDNSHTGDVRFICIEHLPQPSTPSHPGSSHSRSFRSSESSSFVTRPQLVRKRVIYAHSDILRRRSEYFDTMLSSAFAESVYGDVPHGERRVHDVLIEEADFVTMYWLLKWIYANFLLFQEDDDPREAVRNMGSGWSASRLASGEGGSGGEWDVTTLIPDSPVSAAASAATDGSDAGDSSPGTVLSASTRTRASPVVTPTSNNRVARSVSGPSNSGEPSSRPTNRRTNPSGYASSSSVSSPSSSTIPGTPTRPSATTQRPSQRSAGKRAFQPSTDPHSHPTPVPPPASALSIYLIAHRYGLTPLAQLATEHMMRTVTPRTAFALLLASAYWDELRTLLEDYVVANWEAVSRGEGAEEFNRCCQEVATGDWAAFEGGTTLAGLFRRLHRPIFPQ